MLTRWAVLTAWALGSAQAQPSVRPAPVPPDTGVVWAWSGGVTPTGAAVRAGVAPEGALVRLVVAADSLFERPAFVSDYARAGAFGVAEFAATGLTPGTRYHAAVEVEGQLVPALRFATPPPVGTPHSFRMAAASCARTASSHRSFDRIRESAPDLFLHLGDLHYEDIAVDDPAVFADAYRRVLTAPAQAALYAAVPVAYIWDDHDYGPNNSAADAPGRAASRAAYRTFAPHHALAADTLAGAAPGPIHQAFSLGRVRVILLDARSERSPQSMADGPTKTMFGAAQRRWFERELLAAREAHALTIVVSTVPWIAEPEPDSDRWGGYARERAEIAAFVEQHALGERLLMISGDAHMLAFDDGTNNRYGPSGQAGFPVLHAGALDRRGSVKGGPYSHGTFPNRTGPGGEADGGTDGQFALVDVSDDGQRLCVAASGMRQPVEGGDAQELFRWSRCY